MALVKDLIDVSDDDEDVVCLDDHSSGDDSVVCLDDLDGGHRRPELTVPEVPSKDHSKKCEDNSQDLNMTSYHHHETIKPKIELPECGQWPSVVSTSLDNYDSQFTDGPSMVSQYITLSSNGQTAEPDWVDLPFVVPAVDSGRPADYLDHQVADDDALASLEDRLKQLKRERARAYYQTRKAMKPLTAEQKEARERIKQEAREKLREKKLAYRKEKMKKKVEPKPKRHGSEGKGGPSKRRERPPKVTTSH